MPRPFDHVDLQVRSLTRVVLGVGIVNYCLIGIASEKMAKSSI